METERQVYLGDAVLLTKLHVLRKSYLSELSSIRQGFRNRKGRLSSNSITKLLASVFHDEVSKKYPRHLFSEEQLNKLGKRKREGDLADLSDSDDEEDKVAQEEEDSEAAATLTF